MLNMLAHLLSQGNDEERDREEIETIQKERQLIGIEDSSDDNVEEDETSSDSDSSTTSETPEVSSEVDSDMEMRSPEQTRLKRQEGRWERHRYMKIVPRTLYKRERETMARHASLLETHLRCQTPHYALDEATRRDLPSKLECCALYIDESQRAIPVVEAPGTFLVRRSHHYIYSFLVDLALRPHNESPGTRKQRRAHLKQKMRRMRFCNTPHPIPEQKHERYCPLEWVVYTRRSGDLVRYCQRLMDNNAYIDYNMQPGYVPIEELSYHTVNFMCAPQAGISLNYDEVALGDRYEKRTVERDEYMDWVVVPLFYLDLWNASRVTI